MKLIIGNKNYSSWSLRPWLLMTHFGVDFEEVFIPLFSPEMPALMNTYCPTHKVPTLHDEDLIIPDSLAICEYINEVYLDGKGYPADVKCRAQARSLVAEMHAGFMALRSNMAIDVRAVGKVYDKEDAELAKEIARIDAIWSARQGEFLFGDVGIVDCFFAPVAFRFRTFSVDLSDKAAKYQQALLDLPAVRTWEAAARKETQIIEA